MFSKTAKMLTFLTAFLFYSISSMAEEAPLQDPDRFQLGVTGSISADEKWTHISMLKYVKAQDLFLAIGEKPRDQAFVEAALEGLPFGLSEIMDKRLLRVEDGLYYINFNFITNADSKKIYDVGEKFAAPLAAAYMEKADEIREILKSKTQSQISDEYLVYILLGCFSLDWDGLSLTEDMGLRIAGTHQTGEQRYTPWAKEQGNLVSLQYLYWGSHNQTARGRSYTFTSFGDHYSKRRTLPDLFWYALGSVGEGRLPDPIEGLLSEAADPFLEKMLPAIGDILITIKNEPKTVSELAKAQNLPEDDVKTVVAFLAALQYVTETENGYMAAIPILGPEDTEMATRLMALSQKIMRQWLAENFDRISAELGDITALREGVPPGVVFTEVWHYIFGLTNRDLVRAGLFKDPYGADRRYPGALPALWDEAVYSEYRPY